MEEIFMKTKRFSQVLFIATILLIAILLATLVTPPVQETHTQSYIIEDASHTNAEVSNTGSSPYMNMAEISDKDFSNYIEEGSVSQATGGSSKVRFSLPFLR